MSMVVAVSVFFPRVNPCCDGWSGESVNAVSSRRKSTSRSSNLSRNDDSVMGL